MIVCECLALTDRQVRQKLEGGACRLSDLVPKAALEGSCGTCFQALKKMIREHKGPNDSSSSGLRRVETRGIEPLTSTMPLWRSPS
jgi:bacterioferritin-associated ferredoxin